MTWGPVFLGAGLIRLSSFSKGVVMAAKKTKPGKTDSSGNNQYGLDLRLRNQGLIGVGSKIPIKAVSYTHLTLPTILLV